MEKKRCCEYENRVEDCAKIVTDPFVPVAKFMKQEKGTSTWTEFQNAERDAVVRVSGASEFQENFRADFGRGRTKTENSSILAYT
jgi:hypothetical protein